MKSCVDLSRNLGREFQHRLGCDRVRVNGISNNNRSGEARNVEAINGVSQAHAQRFRHAAGDVDRHNFAIGESELVDGARGIVPAPTTIVSKAAACSRNDPLAKHGEHGLRRNTSSERCGSVRGRRGNGPRGPACSRVRERDRRRV